MDVAESNDLIIPIRVEPGETLQDAVADLMALEAEVYERVEQKRKTLPPVKDDGKKYPLEYPIFVTIKATGEQFQLPHAGAFERFVQARDLKQADCVVKQSPEGIPAEENGWRWRRSEHVEWTDNWPAFPVPGDWFVDGEDFIDAEIEPREPFITDTETGGVFLQAASNVGMFAFRGVGKSITRDCLLKLLIDGGVWTRFECEDTVCCW
jgi:hypothetical protein